MYWNSLNEYRSYHFRRFYEKSKNNKNIERENASNLIVYYQMKKKNKKKRSNTSIEWKRIVIFLTYCRPYLQLYGFIYTLSLKWRMVLLASITHLFSSILSRKWWKQHAILRFVFKGKQTHNAISKQVVTRWYLI